MKYYVYILKSKIADKRYVGFTNDLSRRLKEHNSGKSKFTKKFVPWEILYSEIFDTKEEARKREIYFKSAAGRRFISKILNSSPGSSVDRAAVS